MITRKQLDIIAKLISYLFHDQKVEYEKIASDKRKTHIYNDIKIIDQWLESQYKRLEKDDEAKRESE
tara:strand:- start:2552 stop:2752 length:201 start_codon:yes stop_codon:yes gene_type:complete